MSRWNLPFSEYNKFISPISHDNMDKSRLISNYEGVGFFDVFDVSNE